MKEVQEAIKFVLLMDPKERKRQREKDRYGQMSCQQREDRNRKRREAYHRKKVESALINNVEQGIKTSHDGEHHASMLVDQLQSQCNNDDSTILISPDKKPCKRELTNEQVEANRARNRERYANMTPNQRQERRDRQNALNALHRSTITHEQVEANRARDRMRYANMTLEQKKAKSEHLKTLSQEHMEARRQRRRVHNMMPEEKEARRNYEKTRRMLRRKTLHKDSIAMRNPMYMSSDDDS